MRPEPDQRWTDTTEYLLNDALDTDTLPLNLISNLLAEDLTYQISIWLNGFQWPRDPEKKLLRLKQRKMDSEWNI